MTTVFDGMKDADIRSVCKEKIEALEHWLRRLIDDTLQPIYGDYFAHVDTHGRRLIKAAVAQKVAERRAAEPLRYPRNVDAMLLEDAVAILCNPSHFASHFKPALEEAFPEGEQEARTFLGRLLIPRNNLAHANAISVRQAEQIFCYSNDVIESLKNYYRKLGMQQTYDVPLILKMTDSFGNSFTRSQFSMVHDGGISLSFAENPHMALRPGDVLTLEVEVDPSFDQSSFAVNWGSTKAWYTATQPQGVRVIIPITNKQVGQLFDVQCRVTSTKDWHRMSMGVDDFLILHYKVLPPIK